MMGNQFTAKERLEFVAACGLCETGGWAKQELWLANIGGERKIHFYCCPVCKAGLERNPDEVPKAYEKLKKEFEIG